jgi:hypothetical protein
VNIIFVFVIDMIRLYNLLLLRRDLACGWRSFNTEVIGLISEICPQNVAEKGIMYWFVARGSLGMVVV